ncbi:MAG: MBL fold metallo-hydrolase [Chloroflexi bacterium]|nr:MBL fold metallo-hydrolase [Chloroflexota bacterium]
MLKLVKLSPRAYMVQGDPLPEIRENAGFIVSARGAVIVDTTKTLADAQSLYRHVRAVTDKPVAYVINTHAHIDHVFGNQLFPAPVVAHVKTGETMGAMVAGEWSPGGLPRVIEQYERPEDMVGLRIVLPQILFGEALTLDMGDLTVKVIRVGGHSPGSSIVFVPEERTVFLGDLLCVGRYPLLFWANEYGSVEEWLAALKHIKGLGAKRFVPGHGPLSTLKEVKAIESYFLDLKERVLRLAGQGLSREEIVAHPSFPKYAEIAYDRLHPLNIGVAYDQLVKKNDE